MKLAEVRRRKDDLWDMYEYLDMTDWPEEARREWDALTELQFAEYERRSRRTVKRKAKRLAAGGTWVEKSPNFW